MAKFRFEDLKIWQKASDVSLTLLDISDKLDENKKYRFAEQLRGATLSITNNIAEGSGADSDKEFIRFLNYSRRSAFECANIIMLMHKRNFIADEDVYRLKDELEVVCKMITNFKKSIKQ